MEHSGRMFLLRVDLRLNQEWGKAYARMNDPRAAEDLATKPFEVEAWLDAIRIVNYLRRGVPLPKIIYERH
jgi:hypothetical protein